MLQSAVSSQLPAVGRGWQVAGRRWPAVGIQQPAVSRGQRFANRNLRSAACGLRIAVCGFGSQNTCFGAAICLQPPAAGCDLRFAACGSQDTCFDALTLWCRKRRGPSSITTGSLCAAGLEPLARKHLKRAVKNDYSFFTAPFYGGTFRFTFSGTSHSSRLDLPGRSGRAYRSSSHPLRTRLL